MVVFKQKKYQKTHIFILGIWFLTSIWLFLNKKISEHTHFYFGNMVNVVCFVFESVFFFFNFCFFNSSLLVSHFNMVVFKQKNVKNNCIFCF